jgi:hypothetical protein
LAKLPPSAHLRANQPSDIKLIRAALKENNYGKLLKNSKKPPKYFRYLHNRAWAWAITGRGKNDSRDKKGRKKGLFWTI